jgi:hypothetical protein
MSRRPNRRKVINVISISRIFFLTLSSRSLPLTPPLPLSLPSFYAAYTSCSASIYSLLSSFFSPEVTICSISSLEQAVEQLTAEGIVERNARGRIYPRLKSDEALIRLTALGVDSVLYNSVTDLLLSSISDLPPSSSVTPL